MQSVRPAHRAEPQSRLTAAAPGGSGHRGPLPPAPWVHFLGRLCFPEPPANAQPGPPQKRVQPGPPAPHAHITVTRSWAHGSPPGPGTGRRWFTRALPAPTTPYVQGQEGCPCAKATMRGHRPLPARGPREADRGSVPGGWGGRSRDAEVLEDERGDAHQQGLSRGFSSPGGSTRGPSVSGGRGDGRGGATGRRQQRAPQLQLRGGRSGHRARRQESPEVPAPTDPVSTPLPAPGTACTLRGHQHQAPHPPLRVGGRRLR